MIHAWCIVSAIRFGGYKKFDTRKEMMDYAKRNGFSLSHVEDIDTSCEEDDIKIHVYDIPDYLEYKFA